MRIAGISILMVGLSTLLSCNNSSQKEGQIEEGGIMAGRFEETTLGGCDTVRSQGVSIRMKIWEPSDSSEAAKAIRSVLARKVVDRINSYADSATIAANPAAYHDAKASFEVFRKNYNDFKEDFPDAPGCWEVSLEGDTVMVSPKMMAYQLEHYSFTGGAHPNSFLSFHVFDRKTGEEKDMKTFVSDSLALLKIVETAFRKLENLTADADLEQAGYFLADHKFFLPANYIFTRQGVLFYYNPYEIAAYARGPIEFTIPYQELKDIVDTKKVF
jgi:hypothetical protein